MSDLSTTETAVAVAKDRTPPATQKIGRGPAARREERTFYGFIALWLLGFLIFGAAPIIASAAISLTDWTLLGDPSWVGLNNYDRLFNDALFFKTLRNTIYYGLGSVSLGVIVTFLLAILLNQDVPGVTIFRAIYYMPSVVSGIATALLWMMVFNPDYGLFNYMLSWFGIDGPGWLVSQTWVIPALIIMSVWSAGGTMLIYLAGLQGVPQHLYEAATIDGASSWAKFLNITIPMMSPVILFNMVTGFIGSLQAFVLILVMTDGGPANASLVYGLYIYRTAFTYLQMGYASAQAWVLFVVIMAITLLQLSLARRWVYYEGETSR
jgi:multiple sugar transport system permease protein